MDGLWNIIEAKDFRLTMRELRRAPKPFIVVLMETKLNPQAIREKSKLAYAGTFLAWDLQEEYGSCGKMRKLQWKLSHLVVK